MIEKIKEKKRAIQLRKRGLSYSEIIKRLPVTKTSLSLWLKDIRLTRAQQNRLRKKSLTKLNLGAERKREKRLLKTEQIKEGAIKEIGKISKREFWLIGIALYWAEGSKQKKYNPSVRVIFGNSDSKMVRFYLKWLKNFCNIKDEDINFSIYLHETANGKRAQRYWSKITNFPLNRFSNIIWKRHKIKTRRKNVNLDYHGLLRIIVKKSTNLNRKIQGWIEGILIENK